MVTCNLYIHHIHNIKSFWKKTIMRKGNSLTITRNKKDAKNNPNNNLAQFVDNYLKKKRKLI